MLLTVLAGISSSLVVVCRSPCVAPDGPCTALTAAIQQGSSRQSCAKVKDLLLLNVRLLGGRQPCSLSEELLRLDPQIRPVLGLGLLRLLLNPVCRRALCCLSMGRLLLVVVNFFGCLVSPTATGW